MNSIGNAHRGTHRHETRQLRAELGRMLQLRRELATLEVHHDRRLIRRCLIVGSLGAAMTLVGLPLLLQIATQQLADLTTLSAAAWTLIMGAVLLVPGLLLVARAIGKFRSDFRGLRDTLAELNEDLIWLREWMPGGADDGDDDDVHAEEAV
jgi:uncharacterized membrane protein YqjE